MDDLSVDDLTALSAIRGGRGASLDGRTLVRLRRAGLVWKRHRWLTKAGLLRLAELEGRYGAYRGTWPVLTGGTPLRMQFDGVERIGRWPS